MSKPVFLILYPEDDWKIEASIRADNIDDALKIFKKHNLYKPGRVCCREDEAEAAKKYYPN